MTCHVALSCDSAGVLFSDSQASGQRSESHGAQKQFMGADFLVGGAGHGGVIMELFDELQAQAVPITANSVVSFVTDFLENSVAPQSRGLASFIIVTPASDGRFVRVYEPGTMRHPSRARGFATTGSGAEFVYAALRAEERLGIQMQRRTLAEICVAAESYLVCADESLTVDDQMLVGIVANGRSYLIGDRRIRPSHAPRALIQNWLALSVRFEDQVLQRVRYLRSESQQVHRTFSKIRAGELDAGDFGQITVTNQTLAMNMAGLDAALSEFLAHYDSVLGR